jgi:hypothetical protein
MQNEFQFANHAADVDADVVAVLRGERGPGWPLSPEAAKVLRELRNARGAGQARPISELSPLVNLSERDIKEAVRILVVDFCLPVVGSRVKPYGYYLAVTTQERLDAARTLKHEIRALAARVRALEGKQSLREFLGQMQLEEAP